MKLKTLIQKLIGTPEEIPEEKKPVEEVACSVKLEEPYIGVPAPLVPSEDSWFSPTIKTEKTIIKETEMKIQEAEEKKNQPVTKEPDNIHELMYNRATQNQNTTVQLNPPGGSENFQSGPGGWTSGNGQNQFR